MVAVIFAALTTGLFVLAAVGWKLSRSTGLEEVEEQLVPAETGGPKGPGPIVRVAEYLGLRFQRYLVNAYGPHRMAHLDRLLDRAGRPEGMTARDFVRRQAGMIAIGVFTAAMLLMAGLWFPALMTVAVFSGMLPLWLRNLAGRRQASITRELPDFLDVLAVTVSAGLSLQSAMDRVAEADERPLSQEIRRVLEDLRLGVSRRNALTALRNRNDSPSVGSWVTAMIHAEELGAPLSGALNEIAGDIRREAAQLARRQAAKTSPKVSLVVSMVILPGAMLLIIASILLTNADLLGTVF